MSKYYDDIFENFKRIRPNTEIVYWHPSGPCEIVVRTKDGEDIEYYDSIQAFRYINKDEPELSEEEWRCKFSTKLYRKMREAGLTQLDLAKATGLTQVMISKYLNRKATPTHYIMIKICRALGCSVSEFENFNY